MPHIRHRIFAMLMICVAACGGAGPTTEPTNVPAEFPNPFDFIDGYRISHYLDMAVEMQKLDDNARGKRLGELARDPKRASEVYPLCRMLFEAKDKQEFRPPMIGAAHFIDGATDTDWPLQPVTIYEGIPILVVNGYSLGGAAELPRSYVNYCLENCRWREEKFAALDQTQVRNIIAQFIATNPKLTNNADWLRRQAE